MTSQVYLPPLLLLTSLRYDPLLRTHSWNAWPGNPPSPFFLLPYHLERLIDGARDFEWLEALEALGVTAKGEKNVVGNREYKYIDPLERFRFLCQSSVDRYFADNPGSDVDHPLKIRITLSPTGALRADVSFTPRRPYDLLAASTFDPSQLNPSAIDTTLNLSTLTLPPFASPPFHVLLDTQSTSPSILTSHKTTVRPHYDAARARASIPPPSSTTSSSSSPPTEVLLYSPGPLSSALISEGSLRNVAFFRGNRWTTPPLSIGCLPGTVRRCLVESGRVVEGAVLRSEVRVGEWVMLCNGVEGCVLGVVVGDAGYKMNV